MSNPSRQADIPAEVKQAAFFAADLIVCRSQIQFYPDSHPAVAAALDKAILRLAPLLAGGKPLTLGVTSQGLLLSENLIEPHNVKLRGFAELLASFGIIAISFSEATRPEDLLRFSRIINCPRSEIWNSGGIIHAFDVAGIRAIEVQAIDLSVFTLTGEIGLDSDGRPLDSWEFFVRKLLQGCFHSSPEQMPELLAASPARIAGELAAMLGNVPDEARQYTLKALAECYVGQSQHSDTAVINDDSLDKITAFISSLEPKLRCDFILNICNSPQASANFSERLLHNLPEEGLQEVVQSITTNGIQVPDMILGILQRLASHPDLGRDPDLDAAISSTGVGDKVQTLMRETDLEQYIPTRYLQTLAAILATDKLPDADLNLLAELRGTLEPNQLESKVTDIIDEIVMVVPLSEQGEGIRDNLLQQVEYFLSMRDFASLGKVCRILEGGYAGEPSGFINSDFIRQTLDAASILGRDSYPDIREVVTIIGVPFIEPLIDKLATEENRSLRRFWFDCLGGLGEMVRSAALARLKDGEWFVIRNLLVMLRNFSDPEVLSEVRKLTGHKHPKVRSEALRSLLHYQDPAADKLILSELQQSDPVRKLAAIQSAEMSRSKEVMQQLFNLLETTGIGDFQLELKSAAVQTLANIGNPLALPKLLGIISSNPLLHRNKHALLKIEAIRALPLFKPDYVRPILLKISGLPQDPLAVHALEALKTMDGATP